MNRLPTERWVEVQRVLDLALELPAAALPPLLDRECSGDEELRREVEELLQSCVRASAVLEDRPAHLTAALFQARPAPAGRRIGPYLVTGELGRGGMGVVYLAQRDDGQFQQRVALKVLPHGLESDLAIRRFLEERQILASLAHPGIARLLDGGVPPGLSTLLTVEEGDALLHRARRLVDSAVFPTDHTGMRYPWPLV